ncbi:uncharacterized protein LOC107658433 isoform X4 [Sinocyclocheilus anshuiensis]|uniref:uncharacterized protein LOC107658433 isoform X4 n=1 Tax=Sinocyclocheilus anshuiensis TaxID=1608454 RepID=UPI0007B98F4A|nr:PREDICTED: uncharacterized protein LOC107658433 isoform X4 [Sinocyclocheilus anshuiensis]
MSGKVWILITAISFITHVYHVQSKCMKQDIKAHLDELMLEEHVFQIKVFSPETKEHELLSVINTLCSYWTNNKGKDKLKVVQTFHIMLYNLDEKFKDFCENLNCTDAYTVRGIDTATFGEMYRKSCDGSVSDLKCPSKSTPLTTISPTPEFSLTSLTTLVSPNITAPENLTADPSARTETISKFVSCESHFICNEQHNTFSIHSVVTFSGHLTYCAFRKVQHQRSVSLSQSSSHLANLC